MSRQVPLRIVLLKPSKYAADGYVERFRRGFMPNSTVSYLKSLTPAEVDGTPCEVFAFDEYVHTDLDYLSLLAPGADRRTLLALVGVQSHQFHRALDLAALARSRGVENVVIGGPHAMTCETTPLQGRGVSFALAEAEVIWLSILRDAIQGALQPTYGADGRWWGERLDPPPLVPPSRRDLRRYAVRMLGVYPARGCPYTCNFCSVIKIAGRQVRSQPVDTTIASLKAAAAGGVRMVMFTSDNFNKYPDVGDLLAAMIEEKIRLPFFVQCDAQIVRQGFPYRCGTRGDGRRRYPGSDRGAPARPSHVRGYRPRPPRPRRRLPPATPEPLWHRSRAAAAEPCADGRGRRDQPPG